VHCRVAPHGLGAASTRVGEQILTQWWRGAWGPPRPDHAPLSPNLPRGSETPAAVESVIRVLLRVLLQKGAWPCIQKGNPLSTPRRVAIALLTAGLLAACASPVRIISADDLGGGMLRVWLNTCNASGHRVSVDEGGAQVVITVRVPDLPADDEIVDSCSDGVTVELDEPLGDRRLIDGSEASPVQVAP
jgi:hypothetical protein